MGLKPRYLTSTFFAKIANSCSTLIRIITRSIANVSICLYPSLPVEWGAVVFLCWRAISPYKFSRIALTRSARPLGWMNFHENIVTRSSINASCCCMLLTRSKSLRRPYDQLLLQNEKMRPELLLFGQNKSRTIFFSIVTVEILNTLGLNARKSLLASLTPTSTSLPAP